MSTILHCFFLLFFFFGGGGCSSRFQTYYTLHYKVSVICLYFSFCTCILDHVCRLVIGFVVLVMLLCFLAVLLKPKGRIILTVQYGGDSVWVMSLSTGAWLQYRLQSSCNYLFCFQNTDILFCKVPVSKRNFAYTVHVMYLLYLSLLFSILKFELKSLSV